MPDIISRMETMLFEYETTNRTDFRRGEIERPVFTVYKEKPTCLRVRPPPLKDVHTLTAWTGPPIPFHLVHKPKAIIGKDPRVVQKPYVKPPDLEKEQVIKTRPRLVITPAVSMDEIEDRRAREILINDMYTTNTARASKEALSEYFSVKAPLPGLPTTANPITLPPLRPPYVSPEWRMDSVSWDRKQLRTYCDPTKEFWMMRALSPCSVCKTTEAVKAHRKRLCQLHTGK